MELQGNITFFQQFIWPDRPTYNSDSTYGSVTSVRGSDLHTFHFQSLDF